MQSISARIERSHQTVTAGVMMHPLRLFNVLLALLISLGVTAWASTTDQSSEVRTHTDISGKVVDSRKILKNDTLLSPQTRVSLDWGKTSTWIRKDRSFVLHNIEEGEHVLHVESPEYYFEPILINLTLSNSTIHLQPYNPARLPIPTNTPSLPYPIELVPLGKLEYFEQPQGVNVLGMLKNPMVLLMLGTGVLAFFLPKLIDNMNLDPEEAAEIDKIRRTTMNFQNSDWSEKLAGVLSGSSSSPAPSASSRPSAARPSAQAATGPRRRKGR